MSTRFQQSFGSRVLRTMAGGRSFERGAAYADDGRVKRLKVGEEEASGAVQGAQTYRVRLWLEAGEPRFSCTCPVAADGLFCKHCVAVGLLAAEPAGAAATKASRRLKADPVRAYLEGLDKARLVELLIAQADDDELLRSRLEVDAAAAQGAAVDLRGYRRVIRKVINPRGFIDYRSMYDYARGIDDLIDALADQLTAGSGGQVVDLCEYALTCMEDALGNVDDSSGRLGDIKQRLCGLHHDACLVARPDPVGLAERLFEWALHSDWETFLDGAATYADVLGERGLAAYRRCAEKEWARVPAAAPGQELPHSHARFTITYIMETLARVSGDADELVAVKAKDLSSPYHYFQIAEVYRAAGRNDDALKWAERGMEAYPDCIDDRLVEVLADEYERRGRNDEALLAMYGLLERRPILDSYQRLKAHAVKSGAWEVWRGKALEHLRRVGDDRGASFPPLGGAGHATGPQPRDAALDGATSLGMGGITVRRSSALDYLRSPSGRSEVVRALLWEGDADAAWGEAVAGGCPAALWMQLASARAVHHPEDALPIYEQHVQRLIDRKNKASYEEAVAALHVVAELMGRLGRGAQFGEYLAMVRATHKPKRSLMKLLDDSDWPHGKSA